MGCAWTQVQQHVRLPNMYLLLNTSSNDNKQLSQQHAGTITWPWKSSSYLGPSFDILFCDAGDIVGGLLWGCSLWYCSPLQLLLLFLGEIDVERPSDWVCDRGYCYHCERWAVRGLMKSTIKLRIHDAMSFHILDEAHLAVVALYIRRHT
jgi:hypothetical protein